MSYEETKDHTGADMQTVTDPQRYRVTRAVLKGCPEDALR